MRCRGASLRLIFYLANSTSVWQPNQESAGTSSSRLATDFQAELSLAVSPNHATR